MNRKVYCSFFGVIALAAIVIVSGVRLSGQGIFGEYMVEARRQLRTMTTDEKIAQVLIAQHPKTNDVAELEKYQYGGFIFFAEDFHGKSRLEVQTMMKRLQDAAKVPLLIAVDEEGGQVVRVSQNSRLVTERFQSPMALYEHGGLSLIRSDTIQKSQILRELGINLNLAPVVDVSTNLADFMYSRSLGQNAVVTADFARTVIAASQGTGVSYTLKHFPGYGSNTDTHTGVAVDNRTMDEIQNNDLLPFRAGIAAGAEAVLVSHNIVSNIDAEYPASLSEPIHNLLRQDLGFSGVIITDEITMGALEKYPNPAVRAIEVGNDLIITKDAPASFREIKAAIENGTLDEQVLNRAVTKVLAWKLYKGIDFE